jgi:hypothetical protein
LQSVVVVAVVDADVSFVVQMLLTAAAMVVVVWRCMGLAAAICLSALTPY